MKVSSLVFALLLTPAVITPAAGQDPFPPLPDTDGWGVHVLAAARDPYGALWAGTYGKGLFVLRPGAAKWEIIRHDSTETSLSWDFVQALAFGPRGQVWYGTIGNGWGVSLDGGRTWRNWTFRQLGPEWQYVAPSGIVTRAETTWVATADGIQLTTDDGDHWTALVDTVGPPSRGPADTALAVLPAEYLRRIAVHRRGLLINTPGGNYRLTQADGAWQVESVSFAAYPPTASLLLDGIQFRGTPCGLRRSAEAETPCLRPRSARPGEAPAAPRTTWFRRPIAERDNAFIDQTYRYGSTMGGNFQQHQGVEFNNADGTPVHAIGSGIVAYAGPAEAGALTVAIRHDSLLRTSPQRRIYSVYYHNSTLLVSPGDRVTEGEVIARVGNTGRATNDHLHLEVHAAPTDDVAQIVDSLERYPQYTTNPELWIRPLPGTGLLAGLVFDDRGNPVLQARIYGLVKADPADTPFSFIETYGDRAHGHPLYQEHFAIGDVTPGEYVLGVEINGQRVYRTVTIEADKLTWVVFRP